MSRPRDRASAAGLLPRMEARPRKCGLVSYRYHPAGGKPIPLGTDKAIALRRVFDMTNQSDTFGTLRWVWEQFNTASRWLKLAEGTRADYELAWKQIDARLGHMHASEINATVIARYVHVERASSPRRADIEKSLLSRLFSHAIKLGVCNVNPTIGVEPHGSEPRTEAPAADVLAKFLTWIAAQSAQRRIIGMMAEYASLAGSRRAEFLDLSWLQVDERTGVIRLTRAKQRGKKRGEVIDVIEITPMLAALLRRLRALRDERGVECLTVFPTRDNNPYTDRGFKTLWQRTFADAIAAGVITTKDRFTFHDLRAYYATQHKIERGTLPDLHADPGTTARVYDRSKEIKRRAL